MQKPIYLDYAATTPVDPRVANKLMQYLTLDGTFANPASRSHVYGWQAEAAVEKARKQVASLLNADVREIVWTSGATESNNLAIKGVAELSQQSDQRRGRHIITSLAEHKAVIDCVHYLETKGFSVTWLKPEAGGAVAVDAVKNAIREDTLLISLMHVNNETGAITDIDEIGRLARQHGILFHVDAAQSAGKLALDTKTLHADLISVCAHKLYGPKGIGALFVRRKADFVLPAQIHGGGHEQGMRSGTLPTHQIAAMGEAFEIAQHSMADEQAKLAQLKKTFLNHLRDIPGVEINGDQQRCVPGIVNLSFPNIDGQVMLSALPQLAISSGSACTSASLEPSHVLRSMGVSDQSALNALRFSFGRFTTEQEVEFAVELLTTVLDRLAER